MATRCYNGQPLPLQQGPSSFSSVTSSHSFIGNHGNGTPRGLDYHALETHIRPDTVFPSKAAAQPEANPDQGWLLRKEQKRRRLRRICLFICLFVLNVFVSVVVSVLLLSVVSLPASKTSENQRTICFPCSPGDSKADDARRLGETSKDASKEHRPMCCSSGEDDAQMKELILEGVRQSLQERIKGENLYNLLNNPHLPPPINRNAAHVFLKLARRPHRAPKRLLTIAEELDEEYELLRDWSSEGNAAFIRQGIEFNASSGHFKVKDAGIYVIYSRIVFEDNEEEDSEDWPLEDRKRVFGHAISSFTQDRYKDLLKDEQLSHCLPGGVVCYNSRIFSTLHLTKDMTIAVRVLKSNFVSRRSHTSYFGQEEKISRRRSKQMVSPADDLNITVENKLLGKSLSTERLVSLSRLDLGSSSLGSEVAFSARDSVDRDVAKSVPASFSEQVTSSSEKLNSQVDANLESNVPPAKIEQIESSVVHPFISASASPRAAKSDHRLPESFEEKRVNDGKDVDLGDRLTVQGAEGLLDCVEEEDENTRTSLITKSPTNTRRRRACADETVMEDGADKALCFSELSVLRACLGEDRAEVGSTPSCSDFDCSANYESEDEKKMDRSFDSPADFKDSSEFKAERCEAPDYAELFGFQMGDLQDRMDMQTFGQITNHSVSNSPTDSVDGITSSGDDVLSVAGYSVTAASATFPSNADGALAPLRSSGDQTNSNSAADVLPSTGLADCSVAAVSSPLSESYILTPSPAGSMPPSVSLESPISPVDCTGGNTGRPRIASATLILVPGHVSDGSDSWSDTLRRSSSRPLPYPDASSICKLQQLTRRLDDPPGDDDGDDDATVTGMQAELQEAALQQPSPSVACTVPPSLLPPGLRKTSLEPCPMSRLQHLVPEPNHADSYIPLQCGSPFQPPNEQSSHFTDSHPSLSLQNPARLENFQAMNANGRYPSNEDIPGSTDLTPLSFHRRSYQSAFHSHIPNLNFVQPPQFTSTSNFRYVANPAPRRYCQSSVLTPPPSVERSHALSRRYCQSSVLTPPPSVERSHVLSRRYCQSSVLTPPPSVERSHALSRSSQAYPLSYWIGAQDQNHFPARSQDFGFRSSKRSLSSECSPVGGLEGSANSEDCFYNIPYLNSVGAHSLSSAH